MALISLKRGLLLFILALLSYTLFFFVFLSDNPCLLMYDAGHYHDGAIALLQRFSYLRADGTPLFYRLPGYPVFLALLYGLTKIHFLFVLLCQIVLASTLPLLIYAVVSPLTHDKSLASWAVGMAIIAPAYMIFAGLLMSEILFTFLFLSFFWVFVKAMDSPLKKRLFVAAGLFLGALSLVRPIGHLLLLPLILFMLFFLPLNFKQKTVRLTLLGAGWGVMVMPWLMRNFLLTGYLFFHTLPGPHFVNHVASRVEAGSKGISYERAKQLVQARVREQVAHLEVKKERELYEIEKVKIEEQETIRTVWQHPLTFIKLALLNIFKTSCGLYSSELLVIDAAGKLPPYDDTSLWGRMQRYLVPKVQHIPIIGVIWLEIVLLFLSLIGLLLAIKQHGVALFGAKGIFVLGLLFFFSGISFACGYARLRIGVEIFYIVAAAYALRALWRRLERKHS